MAENIHSHLDRIVMDPEILVGKPTVRGTRISVELVLKRLSQDLDLESLFTSYPRLAREDVQACLEFASANSWGVTADLHDGRRNPSSPRA